MLLLGASCDADRNVPPLAPCTVDDSGESAQALQVLAAEVEILTGTLRCRPGRSQGCEDLLREKCVVDVGEVPVGETLRLPVVIKNPSNVDLAVFSAETASENCPDSFIDGLPPSYVQANSDVTIDAIIRPTAAGPCHFDVVVESNGANTNEVTRLQVEATRVTGSTPEGCRTDDACCCPDFEGAEPPSCDDGNRLSCQSGILRFGNESCSDPACVP
jgi:hypothetical protein